MQFYKSGNHQSAFDEDTLSVDEEQSLAKRWRDKRDTRALDRMILTHRRMAVASAMKFRNYGLPVDDLVQEGVIGLLEAAKRFEPEKGFRFSTYAGWWIRASIQDYILRNWSMVRVGTTNQQKSIFFNLGKIRAKIARAEWGEMRKEDVADEFGVSLTELENTCSRLSGRDSSLNIRIGEDGSNEWQDLLEDGGETPDVKVMEDLDYQRLQSRISNELGKLDDREQAVLRHRFFADERMTLASLGKKFSLSKERIRQIEKAALSKLRHSLPDVHAEFTA